MEESVSIIDVAKRLGNINRLYLRLSRNLASLLKNNVIQNIAVRQLRTSQMKISTKLVSMFQKIRIWRIRITTEI